MLEIRDFQGDSIPPAQWTLSAATRVDGEAFVCAAMRKTPPEQGERLFSTLLSETAQAPCSLSDICCRGGACNVGRSTWSKAASYTKNLLHENLAAVGVPSGLVYATARHGQLLKVPLALYEHLASGAWGVLRSAVSA